MRDNFVLGTAGLALAAGYYALAVTIPSSLLDDAVGPSGLPRIYGSMLAALSVALVLTAVIARTRGEASKSEGSREPVILWRLGGMLAIGIAYVVIAPLLGYVLSITALISASTVCQGGRLTGRTALVALGGALVLWVLFVMVLGIPQPAGLWPSLA
jgi:putative tricarboxylic transport membrane protein